MIKLFFVGDKKKATNGISIDAMQCDVNITTEKI